MIETAELRVYCLSKPSLDYEEVYRFLSDEGLDWVRTNGMEAEELVELSGRLCYMSFGRGKQAPRNNAGYINNLITKGHESVLEHAVWTFLIAGVSRAFSHQLVRHRVGFSYSQLSQQYHDESHARFVVPSSIQRDPNLFSLWSKGIEASLELYRNMLAQTDLENHHQFASKKERLRAVRSAARSTLPNATETKIVVTANARSIRHFLDLRGAIEGDPEMRAVSVKLLNQVKFDAPALFQDYSVQAMGDEGEKVVKRE